VRAVVLLCLWLLAALSPPVWAASATPESPQAVIAQAKADLRAASPGLNPSTLTDADIESHLAAIPPIQARLAGVISTLGPRLEDLQARQLQLGAPAAGLPVEDPRMVRTRQDLARALASVTADVQEARLLSLTADQISATLSERLRENFAARLWTRTRSVLDPTLWRDFFGALPGDLARFGRAIGDELDQAAGHAVAGWALMVATLLFGLLLIGPGRIILDRLGYRRAGRGGGEPRLRRVALASWLVFVAAMTPLVAGLLVRAALVQIGGATPAADQLIVLAIRAAVFGAFLEGLGRALLSPGRPEWRLAPAPEGVVSRLSPFPGLVGAAAALTMFVAGLNTILGVSLPTRVATDCLSLLAEMAAVTGALAMIGEARAARLAATPAGPSAAESDSRLPWVLATLAAWLAVGAALLAVLTGYLALASFLMRETVWIAGVLGLMALLLRLADELFPTLLAPEGPMGGRLRTALGLSPGAMEQFGVLLSGVARLLLLLVAAVAVLAPVGASVEDIVQRFTATDFVVRLGLVSISPGAVLGGLGLFAAGLLVTGAVRRWLELRYLPKTNLDVGLRTSLGAGVTYLGALVAMLVAFAYLGLSVAQIALFASALSVGIGFGLQSIISNFVSGLVLLAERPVRVGDWIAIGDLEGDVRKINIRATEIEMMDQSRLIVPNSDLISKTVRNITHSGALGRAKIVLRIDSAADPAQVRDLLLAKLGAHPSALKEPAPAVYMTDARDGAMEFTAFAYLSSPRLAYGVRSDLLFQILPDLKAAGIALAGPATVVNVELGDRSPKPAGGA